MTFLRYKWNIKGITMADERFKTIEEYRRSRNLKTELSEKELPLVKY